jgi:VIT1/CCC1 family predicted Fe2+/Mn2+ transporter
MSVEDAEERAAAVLRNNDLDTVSTPGSDHEVIGTGLQAALSSFSFFALGAVVAIIPYFFSLSGNVAVIVAGILVGFALLATGAIVGLLSGGPPLRRALRQLGIGFGAAAVTYLIGLLISAVLG